MKRTHVVVGLLLLIFASLSSAQLGMEWNTFNLAGHAKANGVDLTIKYPSAWSAKEGERPRIAKKFVSPDGLAYAMIVVVDLGQSVTAAEAADFFRPSELKGLVPEGMTYISSETTQLEGLPAGILEYSARMARLSAQVDQRVWSVVAIYDRSLVQFQFYVGGLTGNVDTSALMRQYKPVFLSMANSVVFHGKWHAALAQENNAVSGSSLMDMWQLNEQSPGFFYIYLFLSFVITWTVGLIPPLVIRYLILKRPMTPKAATWTSVSVCVVMWFLSVLLTAWAEEKQGSHFWVFLLFFVARWVLTRPAPLPPREIRPLNEQRP